MKSFLKNFRTAANCIGKPNLITIMFLLAGMCLAPPTFGQTEIDPCAPSEYPFIGMPEATLCDQHGNLTCNVEVGLGTPITHSSQLGTTYTGNVCVKGDFRIDNNFKFINCVVKIDPGVTILVLPPPSPIVSRIFTIDNSKLFACEQMWNGIQLSNNTAISTKNNTVIEDAIAAIKADNIQFSVLLIENTTFNRDQIGILLMQDPTLPKAATIARFNTNKFLCTSPLNGTTDQITFAGIKTVGVPFTLNPSTEAYHNLFQGLQYGIVAEGVNTTIAGRFFRFRNLRRDGIKLDEGSLTLRQSFWHNCEEKGVNISLAHKVDIRESCLMTINTDIPAIAFPNYREGVYIGSFGLNSSVNLNLGFSANLEGTTTPVRGVHLKGGNVGAGTKISIFQSSFSIRARASDGIFLDGSFPASSETHIFGCGFATGNTENNGSTSGIRLEGNKNNLNIYANIFTGNGYWNFAIRGSGSTGTNNYIADNYIEGTGYIVTSGDYFSKGFFFNNFQNTTFCSNTNYFGSNYAFEFWGTNTGTDFVNNKVYATAAALDIFTNSLIGPQSHKGNEWHPVIASAPPLIITFRASYHARCQTATMADDNHFTVHTNQSVWNDVTDTYDFFSEFHPENIEPDVMDEFFGTQSGTPSSGCSVQLNEPGGGELDKIIADGLLQVPTGNPSMGWISRSYLYKKLKENPGLVGTYAPYSTFLASYANTNVGQFYEVSKKIADAYTASETLDQQSREILDDMDGVLANLTVVDAQLEASTNENEILSLSATKSAYLEQLRTLQGQYNSVYDSYKAQVVSLLQEALALNQQITPVDQLESNEKTVMGIWLQSVLNQGGSLTEAQITELKNIGRQCPETGGLAVNYALTLLPECEKDGLELCSPEPVDDLEPLSSYSSGGQGLMAPPSSPGNVWLYPNPTSSAFYVELPGRDTGELTVTDLTGRSVFVRQFIDEGTRAEVTQPLSPGVYLVRIKTDKGAVLTEKLVVQSR